MIEKAAQLLMEAKYAIAFTGAGISVESGIPSFRGKNGLWDKVDPVLIESNYFREHPEKSWPVIRDLFYSPISKALPNRAHQALAQLEKERLLQCVITQNIDGLQQAAGSKQVVDFHGTAELLKCIKCESRFNRKTISLEKLPPVCPHCGHFLKPDFVFFGEAIPEPANSQSFSEAQKADVVLVIGTSGNVMPACMVPHLAKQNGATIIEINTQHSSFTSQITDVFLKGGAEEIMNNIMVLLDNEQKH